jgi:chaperonin GroEL (HSP60 family)
MFWRKERIAADRKREMHDAWTTTRSIHSIGVLTGGGDVPGLNRHLRKVRQLADNMNARTERSEST